jgi:hypothetical protein
MTNGMGIEHATGRELVHSPVSPLLESFSVLR